jgi:dipeptidyl aminopeptidase/acylaminoacyl peptidase
MRRRTFPHAVMAAAIGASVLTIAPTAGAHPTRIGRIAYVDAIDGHSAIFSIDPAQPFTGTPLIDLGDRDASEPAWSFDGTQIAFTAPSSSGGPTALFVAKDDGSALRQLTVPEAGESDSDPSWSPNGDEVVFARALPNGTSGLRVVNVASGDVRPLDFPSLPTASEPDWSPEGSRIVFVAKRVIDPSACDTDPTSCLWKLFIANADGSGEPRAINATDGFDYHNPDWSPDALAVAADLSVTLDRMYRFVQVIDLASSGGRTLDEADPSFSPYNFNEIVATRSSEESSILFLYPEGDQSATLLAIGTQPAWGPSEHPCNPTPGIRDDSSYDRIHVPDERAGVVAGRSWSRRFRGCHGRGRSLHIGRAVPTEFLLAPRLDESRGRSALQCGCGR